MDLYRFGEYETRVIECHGQRPGNKRLAQDLAAGGGLAPRMDVDWLDGGQVRGDHSLVGWSRALLRRGDSRRAEIDRRKSSRPSHDRICRKHPATRTFAHRRSLPGEGTDLFDLMSCY